MGTDNNIYDPAFVKGVFDRCSEKYILFSYVCSFGFVERWRRQCVNALAASRQQGMECIDLMAGTGEAWPHLLHSYPDLAGIVAVDISSGMHKRAMVRLHHHRAHRIRFVEDNVLNSALAEESADLIISTFGLKTFNQLQQALLAQVVARTLKPGGRFSFVEASDPKGWIFRPLYLFYLKSVLPLIERFLLKGAQDFAMIGTYTTNFGGAETFADLLRKEGLEVEFRKYFFGCATGVAGTKPIRHSAD